MHFSNFTKVIFLTIILAIFQLPCLIAQPAVLSNFVYGSSEREDLKQVLPTADGGFIMLAHTFKYSVGDIVDNGDITDDRISGDDIWVAKCDAAGTVLWNEIIGGDNSENPIEIIPTLDGGYLILSTSLSGISGDKTEASRGNQSGDVWLVKIDEQGQKIWDKTYGTFGGETPSAIIALPDGGFVITINAYNSTAEFEKSEGGRGNDDGWLLRIDAIGNVIWEKTMGGRNLDNINDLLLSEDGALIVVGGSSSFNDGIVTNSPTVGIAFWMIKLDLEGNVIWEKRFDGMSYDMGYQVVQANDGGYLLVGETYSDVGIDKNSPKFSHQDVWAIKINQEGEKLWDKTFGGYFVDDIQDVIALPSGHFLLCGSSESEAGGTKAEPNRGSRDFWVWEIDEFGNVVWDKIFGADGYDEAISLWWKGNGIFTIGGCSNSDVGYEKTIPEIGNSDIWLLNVEIQDHLPNYPASPMPVCENAPIFCNLDNYHSATQAANQIACALPFCNDWILAENTNWHGFYAGAENITLRITTSNCSNTASNVGVEAAIYGDCEALNLVSNCWKETGEQTFELIANNLTTNQLYYLMIDGIKGSFCDYVIEVVEGSTRLTPPDVSVTSPVTGCFVDELVLDNNTVNSDGNTNLVWLTNNGKLLNGATTITPTIGKSGTYQLIATRTANFCVSDTIAKSVEVESRAIKAGFIPNGCDSEITLNATQSIVEQGANFTWSSTAGGQILSGNNTLTPTALNAGSYTLNISLDDCETSQTLNLPEDAPVPQINIAPYPELQCYDYDIEIDATASTESPKFDYYWNSLTGGYLYNFFFYPLEAEIEDGGIYSLVIRNRETGCQDSTAFEVVRAATYFNTTPTWSRIGCDGMPVTLGVEVFPQDSFDLLYEEWSTTNGHFITATDIPNPQIDTPGWYSGGVYDLDSECFSLFGFQVYEEEVDSIIITPSGELSCLNENITLAAYDTPYFRTYDYNWTTTNGTIVTGSNEHDVTIASGGTYYLEVNYKGCVAVDSIIIPEISPAPAITFTDTYSVDCNGSPVTLEIEETYPDSNFCFWWETEDGNILNAPNQLTVEADAVGTYKLRVTNIITGCFSENTIMVTENSESPIASLAPTASINCGQQNLFLDATNSSQNAPFSFQWTTSDGIFITGTETLMPTVGAAGIYSLTIINDDNGCTAVAQISVTDNRYQVETISEISICSGQVYSVGNSTYDAPGFYQDTLLNFENCDSIIQTQLTILPTNENLQTISICDGENIQIGNETFAETGIYQIVLTNGFGCDSTIILDLTIFPNQITPVNTQLCTGESIQIGNETFTETGNYEILLINDFGCDSLILLDLTISPNQITPINTQLCAGESIQIGNETFTETGNYEILLTNDFGCDSLIDLQLEIVDNYQINLNETICPNETIEVGGLLFDTTGVYEIPMVSSTGCDSLVTLNLSLSQEYFIPIEAIICFGETYTLAGNDFSTTGNYQILLESSAGCDSLLELNLQVEQLFLTNLETAICEGENYAFGNDLLSETGVYFDTLISYLGCDSILSLDLTIIPELSLMDTIILADTGSGNGSISTFIIGGFPPYQYNWSNGANNPNIENLPTGIYELTVTDSAGCIINFTFFVDNLNAVTQHDFVHQFNILPNPSNGNFEIALELLQTEAWTISLHHINGQVVNEWKASQLNLQQANLAVEDLETGVYVVNLLINGVVIRRELVVIQH